MFAGRDREVQAAWQAAGAPLPLPVPGATLAEAIVQAGGAGARARLLAAIAQAVGRPLVAGALPEALPPWATPIAVAEWTQLGAWPWRAPEGDGPALVAVADPWQPSLADTLAWRLRLPVALAVADPARLRERWAAAVALDGPAATDLTTWTEALLARAVAEHAADVHLEDPGTPPSAPPRLRLRLTGGLVDVAPPPGVPAAALVAHLKHRAGLNAAERRLPQDGRLRLSLLGRAVDFRLACLPTATRLGEATGESLVLRLLDPAEGAWRLADLGLRPDQQAAMLAAAESGDGGLLLAAGPTGAGKTTTLYALLRHLLQADIHLVTIEDPVEYLLPGAVQVPVRPEVGLTFAQALRALLRHAPDVLLVGEVRDAETAALAAQAALTGHRVLASIHAPTALGTVTRLLDLGVERYVLAATLRLLVAQRLVRLLCPACGGRGCPACGFTGWAGRQAIFEVWRPTEADLAALHAGADPATLPGPRPTLAEAGHALVARSLTTALELQRTLLAPLPHD